MKTLECIELSPSEIGTIIASTYFQYAVEKDEKYKLAIKAIHNKLSKLVKQSSMIEVCVNKDLIREAKNRP